MVVCARRIARHRFMEVKPFVEWLKNPDNVVSPDPVCATYTCWTRDCFVKVCLNRDIGICLFRS